MKWRTRFAYAFRRTALSLLSYYAVTIALPLANGAAQSGAAFTEHALVVLVVPPLVVVFAFGVHAIGRAIWAAVCVRSVRL
jgi:hypothetical protein